MCESPKTMQTLLRQLLALFINLDISVRVLPTRSVMRRIFLDTLWTNVASVPIWYSGSIRYWECKKDQDLGGTLHRRKKCCMRQLRFQDKSICKNRSCQLMIETTGKDKSSSVSFASDTSFATNDGRSHPDERNRLPCFTFYVPRIGFV